MRFKTLALATIAAAAFAAPAFAHHSFAMFDQDKTITVNGNTVFSPSMDYRDNPVRPQTHYWFGPMTMLDFMGNFCLGSYNTNTSSFDANRLWWPGTCHEAPLWQCKVGMAGALNDMQTNHPNDYASLILFSVPKCGNYPSGTYNYTPVPMGQNYTKLLDSLWFSPETISGQTFTRTLSPGNTTGSGSGGFAGAAATVGTG